VVLSAIHACSGYGGMELGLKLAGISTRTACHTGLQQEMISKDGKDGLIKMDLNPQFVESLMGVPKDWSMPFISSEMGLYHRWLQQRSYRLPKEQDY